MALQTGVGATVSVKEETSWGVAPTASGSQFIRRVSWTPALRQGTVQSAEVRVDRAISDYRLTNRSVSGDYTGELSVTGQIDYLRWMAGNAWVAGVSSGALTNVTAASSPDTLTRSTGSWVTDGFRVGDIIRMTGWTSGAVANNNKNFRIVTLTATVMTVSLASPNDTVTLVAKAAGDSVTTVVPGFKLNSPGTTKYSHSAENKYTDLSPAQYELVTGIRVNTAAFRLDPAGMVGFTFGLLGKDVATLSTTEYFTSPTAADQSDILTFAQSKVRLGGVDVGTVTGIDFTIDNSMTTVAVGGSRFTPDVFYGRQPISGTITAMFESEVLPNAFNAESELALDIFLEAPSGSPDNDFNSITFPRIKLGGADRPLNTEQGIPLTLPFVALKPRTAQTSVNYDTGTLVWRRSA